MGLTYSRHNPCLFSGIIDDVTSPTIPIHTIHVSLYVDGFVFFSESNTEESCFKQLLNKTITTDFMGKSDFFLVSSFEWN